MTQNDDGLVSPSDIADVAAVSRAAVSNWRRRGKNFPQPVAGTASKPLFSRAEVDDWLERHASRTKNESLLPSSADGLGMRVWAVLNTLRGSLTAEAVAELVLNLAVARKAGAPLPFEAEGVDPSALMQLERVLDEIPVSKLAEVVDFSLARLARSQGKVGAEFGFVGSRTTTMLAKLAASCKGGVLYDPACGIAAALVEAVERGASPDRIVGHDISIRALHIAEQRAVLHGIDLELTRTNVLTEDADPCLRARTVILEPPFSLKWDAPERLMDPRFDFGLPPRSNADTAWLQHAIAHLDDDGRAYVLGPVGTLFRGGVEGRIRTEMIRRGCVEAVVGLPGKLLPHTSIPLALWVLLRPSDVRPNETVLLIDASRATAPEDNVADWLTRSEARDGVPWVDVTVADLIDEDSVLLPQRWVDRTDNHPEDIAGNYLASWAAIRETVHNLQSAVTPTEVLRNPSKPRVLTVSNLIDQNVLELRMGRSKDRYVDAPDTLQNRFATASDVRDGTLRNAGLCTSFHDYPELTQRGDVLVTTMNTVRARVDDVGGHLPSTGVYRLRVSNREVLSPEYLAIVLAGPWNERFQGGTTIHRAPIKELEVPLVPLTEQQEITEAMRSVHSVLAGSARLEDNARSAAAAMLDALRYHVALLEPAGALGTSVQNGREESKENR